MDYYNKEVFGTSSEPASASAALSSASQYHTWEDDFLQQLDSETPALTPPPAPVFIPRPGLAPAPIPASASAPIPASASAPAPAPAPIPAPAPVSPLAPISPQLTYVSAPVESHADVIDIVSNYQCTAMSISQGGAITSNSATIDTQLQVDISQLSLQDSTEPSALKGRRVPAAARKRHTATQQAPLAMDSDVAPIIPLAPPPPVKHVTRNGGSRAKKLTGKSK
ncbi:hypothetical protein F4604DRAFT_1678592 [Suillus subluteus]|nr:hypothetical protein F4604DRAFT_1678592 [Suillus subluteus]